jgi:hypothetical protein
MRYELEFEAEGELDQTSEVSADDIESAERRIEDKVSLLLVELFGSVWIKKLRLRLKRVRRLPRVFSETG